MNKSSVNKVILVGRIGQKPDLKYSTTGTAIVNISVATVESVKKGDGYEDVTEWHRIVIFGKIAEFVEKFLDKGSLVYVEGRLQTRSWDDKEGKRQYMTETVASVVTPLGSKPKSDTGRTEANSNPFDEPDEPLPF